MTAQKFDADRQHAANEFQRQEQIDREMWAALNRPMPSQSLPHGTFVVGNALYGRCEMCAKIVRINKWLFGSFHICLTDEEIAAKRRRG